MNVILVLLLVTSLVSAQSAETSTTVKPKKNFTEIATDEELSDLVNDFFHVDQINFLPYVKINLQGYHNTSNMTEDRAPEPLLTLSEIFELNTIKKMTVMYDNYERNSSVDELVTADEMREESEFIEALLETAVIKKLMKFLEEKKLVAANESSAHYALIKNLWFDFYPRAKGTNSSSSGFEHVFLTEIKKKKLIGFHNWIYLAHLEKTGELNYKGWLGCSDLGDRAKIIKIRFDIAGRSKTVSSMFIGTSPEIEFAIYTLCFKLRANRRCNLSYQDVKFFVNTHSIRHKNKKLIASAYVAFL